MIYIQYIQNLFIGSFLFAFFHFAQANPQESNGDLLNSLIQDISITLEKLHLAEGNIEGIHALQSLCQTTQVDADIAMLEKKLERLSAADTSDPFVEMELSTVQTELQELTKVKAECDTQRQNNTGSVDRLNKKINGLKLTLNEQTELLTNLKIDELKNKGIRKTKDIYFQCLDGNRTQCSNSARADALRNLSEELFGGDLSSQSVMQNFAMMNDEITIKTNGKVKSSSVENPTFSNNEQGELVFSGTLEAVFDSEISEADIDTVRTKIRLFVENLKP